MLIVARETVRQFPAPFADLARDVALQVEDWPPDWLLRDMDIDDPRDLTGVYLGVPLTEKSWDEQPLAPDAVWLFRQPILLELRDRPGITIERLVAHVTVHEFAHHFGWSDEDIATIDRWWL